MVHQSRTAAVSLFLIAAVLAAASVPLATAFGCYDDCYERCANGKQDPACVKMCNEACGGGVASTLLGGATAAAGAGASVVGAGASAVGAGANAVGAGASAAVGAGASAVGAAGAAAPTA
jgi:hypothetical protein